MLHERQHMFLGSTVCQTACIAFRLKHAAARNEDQHVTGAYPASAPTVHKDKTRWNPLHTLQQVDLDWLLPVLSLAQSCHPSHVLLHSHQHTALHPHTSHLTLTNTQHCTLISPYSHTVPFTVVTLTSAEDCTLTHFPYSHTNTQHCTPQA